MGEGKHTAGPLDWEARGVDGQAHIYLTDSTGRKIGTLWGRPDEKIANAHLFKAAPDLLAVCCELAQALADDKSIVRNDAFESDDADWLLTNARAAIAKATGVDQ